MGSDAVAIDRSNTAVGRPKKMYDLLLRETRFVVACWRQFSDFGFGARKITGFELRFERVMPSDP